MKSIHATAVLIGEKAWLFQGVSGSGKSTLALRILQDKSRFSRLIGDDRVYLKAFNGKLIVTPAIKGLLEVRGQGIIALPFEQQAVVGGVLELGCDQIDRLPDPRKITLQGVDVPYFLVKTGCDPLPFLISLLETKQF